MNQADYLNLATNEVATPDTVNLEAVIDRLRVEEAAVNAGDVASPSPARRGHVYSRESAGASPSKESHSTGMASNPLDRNTLVRGSAARGVRVGAAVVDRRRLEPIKRHAQQIVRQTPAGGAK